MKLSTTFSRSVALPGIIVLVLLSIFCGLFPTETALILDKLQLFFYENLSWLYIFFVVFFLVFLFVLAFSKMGNIKLGTDNSEPQHSFIAWVSMLFSAGMGIGLMYFGVAEPLSHYVIPPMSEYQFNEGEALFSTFMHWGIHAWAIYAVMGLILAYFSYRYKLPLAMRSGLYPLLKNKINGAVGDIIDIFALCCTFFGITTSLGFGVVQLNSGLAYLNILPNNSFIWQSVIVFVVLSVAVISASSGVNKGVKILSELNLLLAFILMIFILVTGPTVHILGAFSDALGIYTGNFISRTFNTFTFTPEGKSWLSNWTIMYWAWWISWSPFVGLFIAKISKGRTIREFILVVMFVPTLFVFLWMTIFGSGAIWMDANVAFGALSSMVNDPDSLLFNFLQLFPFAKLLCALAVLMITVFFVTSADSGIMVLNSIASKNKGKTPVWQNTFWGVVMGILSLLLLRSGGLKALQTMTLLTALPFGLIMCLLCYCLYKALKIDMLFHKTKLPSGSRNWDSSRWKDYLDQILSFTKKSDVREFIETNVRPAFEELSEAFKEKGIEAEIREGREGKTSIELLIRYDQLQNFKYGVMADRQEISQYVIDEDNAPTPESEVYIPVSYYNNGRKGNDIQHYDKMNIITEVLTEYERFINIAADKRSEILILDRSV